MSKTHGSESRIKSDPRQDTDRSCGPVNLMFLGAEWGDGVTETLDLHRAVWVCVPILLQRCSTWHGYGMGHTVTYGAEEPSALPGLTALPQQPSDNLPSDS